MGATWLLDLPAMLAQGFSNSPDDKRTVPHMDDEASGRHCRCSSTS